MPCRDGPDLEGPDDLKIHTAHKTAPSPQTITVHEATREYTLTLDNWTSGQNLFLDFVDWILGSVNCW